MFELQLKNFWAWYRASASRMAVLQAVSLRFDSGRVHFLCGENGSGKSSLLRALVGDPTLESSGEVSICSRPSGREQAQGLERSRWAYLPQNQSFAFSDTVDDYLNFYREHRGFSAELLGRHLDTFQVSHLSHEFLTTLSGGQWRRVQCAVFFALRRKVCLLDEPESALDQSGYYRLRAEIQRAAREGQLIVIASHSARMVDELAETVTVLERGTVVWHSDIQEYRKLRPSCGPSVT